MPNETTGATGTQADPGTQPPAGDQSSQADGGSGEQPTNQPESISLEEAKKLRSEANSLRKRLHDLEAAKATADAAALTDTEKAIAQAKKDGGAEVLAKVQSQIRRSEVRAALTAAGVNAALLDLAVKADEFGALAISDEGEVDGLGAAVEAFRKGHPDLFTKPVQAGTAGGGNRGSARLTKEEVDRITKDPVEYDKRRDEVMAWMATKQN